MDKPPVLRGNVEVAPCNDGVIIAGDPTGLRSLAQALNWLASLDQDSLPNMPDGERSHIHLYSTSSLSINSENLELCRLDAKGTGKYPAHFEAADDPWRAAYPVWFLDDDEE